jgi:hypothetical protein
MQDNDGEDRLVNAQDTAAAGDQIPEEEAKPKHIYKLKYRFLKGEEVFEDGEAKSEIADDRLVLLPVNGMRFELIYRDILTAKAEDYALTMKLKGGEAAEVYFLGLDYESYVANFFKGYNKIARKDSFMGETAETVRKGAKYRFTKSGVTEQGGCDVAYGKTAVILQRDQGDPARIPFALIERTETTPYSIRYITESGGEWEIYMLADRYDKCLEVYSKNIAERVKASADAVKEAKKDITPLALRKAAELFLDGRAVSKASADAVYPGLFEAVCRRSEAYGAKEYFDCLYEKSSDTLIGFKKALLSGEEDYLWMLCHIGSAIVLEAASPGETGRATYVFSAGEDAAGTMRLVNYCMHMTEFRREPVYMSEQELQKPDNAKYLSALRRVPELLTLRKLYSKRVAHTSVDKWKENLFK